MQSAEAIADPVEAARVAIWRLFQEGYVDEDMATGALLAVDLGTRRARRNARIADASLGCSRPGAAARPLARRPRS